MWYICTQHSMSTYAVIININVLLQNAFVRFFDNGASEKKVLKGLLFAGIGLASLATAVTKQ